MRWRTYDRTVARSRAYEAIADQHTIGLLARVSPVSFYQCPGVGDWGAASAFKDANRIVATHLTWCTSAMTSEERLQEAFRYGLALPKNFDVNTATPDRILQWDSVGHLQLVIAIEDAFNIRLNASEIIEMESYAKAKNILVRRCIWT